MHSPGFFPNGYLCKPYNGGYDVVRALAEKYRFDPVETPWCRMTGEAQKAFLFGDGEPLAVIFQSGSGRSLVKKIDFSGFYGWLADWDVGGTYSETVVCSSCGGSRLKREYAEVTLAGLTLHELRSMTLSRLLEELRKVRFPDSEPGNRPEFQSLDTMIRRLEFLVKVGLPYLDLGRIVATLSAGEAQRIKLSSLLESGLSSLTVLLDEPTRGMHPTEVRELFSVIRELSDGGSTVIAVEHDLDFIRNADFIVDMGPGAGMKGGRISAIGSPADVVSSGTATGHWLSGKTHTVTAEGRQNPVEWLTVRKPRAFNLAGADVTIPLGVLVGICGVSGSGKSALIVDTVGRALCPATHTTSVAREPVDPGEHDGIEGAPSRTVIVDQAQAGIVNPFHYLRLDRLFYKLYAESGDAASLGIGEEQVSFRCTSCRGKGFVTTDMGFLPSLRNFCEACRGTGYSQETRSIRLREMTLPELLSTSVDRVLRIWADEPEVAAKLTLMKEVGLGYLNLRQPSHSLSGGETQRLKIVKELNRKAAESTLYILDEPTVGQHNEDVFRLASVLMRLRDAGHSVLVIEHHPLLLAYCDWLIEMGPGGGPDGGKIIASSSPEKLAAGSTPTAEFLREFLEQNTLLEDTTE